METVIICALISIVQLVIYVYRSEDSKMLRMTRNQQPIMTVLKDQTHTSQDNVNQFQQGILTKNLKHLEFITQFESYLETENALNFSAEFLQEFEAIKRKAQVSTVKSVQIVKHKTAA